MLWLIQGWNQDSWDCPADIEFVIEKEDKPTKEEAISVATRETFIDPGDNLSWDIEEFQTYKV